MLPRLAGVSGFINSIAHGEIRTMEPFAACNIESICVGRRHGDGPDGLRRLAVEDRVPGSAIVVALPDAAVALTHIEDIRLPRYTRRRTGAASAKGTDHAPVHLRQGHGVRLFG